ncbi:hypothetical protein PFISCL1PPCAC_14344, partial [Pristionchus fissidentatus]
RIISDDLLVIICSTIGFVSLAINIGCFFLLVKVHEIYGRRFLIILITLQVLLTIENFHFTVLYIPFMYITLSGGYCIGLMCGRHLLPFQLHEAFSIFLLVNISGMFMVLLFYRHQSVLNASSALKLRGFASHAIVFLLLTGINALPIAYSIRNIMASAEKPERLLRKQCPQCDWIEKRRNFGVMSAQD